MKSGGREAPPPAKLIELKQGESWCCYYCETFLVQCDFPGLKEREVRKCGACGRFQVIGTGEGVRRAACNADSAAVIAGEREQLAAESPESLVLGRVMSSSGHIIDLDSLPSSHKKAPLAPGFDATRLRKIQAAHDDLIRRFGRAPKEKVAKVAGVSRNTVDKYWPYVST